MRLAPFAPVLIALTACGVADTVAPEAPTESPAAMGSEGDTGRSTEAGTEPGHIPDRFHGLWDAGGSNCDPASETRIDVGGRRITFYESVGNAAGVSMESGDVIADLVMEGEGKTELRIVRLQLTTIEGREALLLLPGVESDVPLRPVPRFRCPI